MNSEVTPRLEGEDQYAELAALRAALDAARGRIAQLERIADTDSLTPLPNRRFFARALEGAIARIARHGRPAVVMFVDLDGLKAINDRHGHAAGDAALIHAAKLLRRNIRLSDTVARIGGDEFGILLEEMGAATADAKAGALARLIAGEPLAYYGGAIALTVSIGATVISGDDSAESALARADAAMYAARRR